jgi:DNA replication licensing factor MCM6
MYVHTSAKVRPELVLGTFRCNQCQTLRENIRQQFTFTEPTFCKKDGCANTKSWVLEPAASSFYDWQQLNLQEDANAIASGR